MKAFLGIAVVVLATLPSVSGLGKPRQSESAKPALTRQPVVVELFTAEGCSSCPPADLLLAKLDSAQPLAPAQVIALEEHVDYWDEQGWKDPFSSYVWTERQREYAGTLRSGNPYTPQMVIDGTVGFVGSHSAMARDAILKAAAEQKTKIDLTETTPVENKSVTFKVDIEKLIGASPKDSSEVILGITENGLHSSVKAGENSGKELSHSAVLRELKVLGVVGKYGKDSFSSQPSVKLDSKWDVANLRAVVFVQERKSRRILGAAEIHLTQ